MMSSPRYLAFGLDKGDRLLGCAGAPVKRRVAGWLGSSATRRPGAASRLTTRHRPGNAVTFDAGGAMMPRTQSHPFSCA